MRLYNFRLKNATAEWDYADNDIVTHVLIGSSSAAADFAATSTRWGQLFDH